MKEWLLRKRRRVIMAGLMIVAVPLLALSVFVRMQVTGALEERLDKETLWLSVTASRHLDMSLKGNINVGRLFVTRPLLLEAIKKGDRTILTTHLKILTDTVPELDRAFITTPKGVQAANYPETPATLGVDFSDRDWYKGVSKDWLPYVSGFYIRTAEPRRYLFAIALPIRIEGEVRAILVMQPRADYIKNILNSIEIGRGRIYAVDRKGHLIHHPDYVLDRIVDFSEVPAVQNAISGQRGVLKTSDTAKAERYYSAYSPVKEWGWAVVVEKPEEVVLDPVRKITSWIFAITGLMLLLGGYFAYRGAALLVETQKLSGRLREDEQLEKSYNDILVLLNMPWDDLKDLCTACLRKLGEHTCAEAGLIYLRNNEVLTPCSSLGAEPAAKPDSLAQEAIMQGALLRLQNIPQDTLLRIGTGMATLVPKDIIAIPLIYKEEPVGVLELACIHGFGEKDLKVLKNMAPQLAIGINTLKNQMATKILNDELARSNEETQAMNEELQAMNEELQAQQGEISEVNRRLEEVSRTKSDFLANMSHELRTPLNSIIGFSELLQDELYGRLNQKQTEYVGDILGSGRHLLSLINDILDLAKVESGRMELELSSFPLRDVLNASLSLFREKALKHSLQLTCDVAPDADIVIEADERKLKQIMFNLLSNALKFTPDGGSVKVKAQRGKAKELPLLPPLSKGREGGVTGEPIEISVTDTGIGIKEEDVPKLFKEFTQLESAYTKQHDGTGLGLALTKKLIDLHQGRIWVESVEGKGSRFFFTIPVKHVIETAAAADREGCSVSTPSDGRKALAIDDDHRALSIIEEALKAEGYSVLKASDGYSGLGVAHQESPELIVLDLMMPGMTGFEVLDRLKSDKKTASVPVIILTGMDLSGEEKARLEGKGLCIVEKGSLAKEEFAAKVREAISRDYSINKGT
ncbi:MAG: response regulator [Nitrospirae bacterium]|nr:response regulator [Nitrospirota bacterium]